MIGGDDMKAVCDTYGYNRMPEEMARVQRIISHEFFIQTMKDLQCLEADRIWCGHDLEHLLAVSRIMWIDCLEGMSGAYAKDVVYATGLLHDIGRAAQYRENEPHEIAGVRIAKLILNDAAYTADEQALILGAIGSHRKPAAEEEMRTLADLLYRADKISRSCYACDAADTCSWEDKKRTHGVIV